MPTGQKRIYDVVPPLVGAFKHNFDGSSLGSPGMASVGGLVCDSECVIVTVLRSFPILAQLAIVQLTKLSF